jgi:hypothetical protein
MRSNSSSKLEAHTCRISAAGFANPPSMAPGSGLWVHAYPRRRRRRAESFARQRWECRGGLGGDCFWFGDCGEDARPWLIYWLCRSRLWSVTARVREKGEEGWGCFEMCVEENGRWSE